MPTLKEGGFGGAEMRSLCFPTRRVRRPVGRVVDHRIPMRLGSQTRTVARVVFYLFSPSSQGNSYLHAYVPGIYGFRTAVFLPAHSELISLGGDSGL